MVHQVLGLWRPGQRNCVGVELSKEVVVFAFTKKKDVFRIEKVCKCELFDDVYEIAVTLGFLLDKYFCM